MVLCQVHGEDQVNGVQVWAIQEWVIQELGEVWEVTQDGVDTVHSEVEPHG